MTAKSTAQGGDARQIFAGRIDVLYTMGRHYLSLPFAALCVPATLLSGNRLGFLSVTPLALLMAVVIASEQLTTAYRNRKPGSDPHYWARRYTFVSAIGDRKSPSRWAKRRPRPSRGCRRPSLCTA